MSAYTKIPSHFTNLQGNDFDHQTQILSDATDVACAILGITPKQLRMWQGSWNPHDAKNSEGFHVKANCADYALPGGISHDRFVEVMSFIGVFGWIRDTSAAGGGMRPEHFHCFAGFYTAKASVSAGIIGQNRTYLGGGTGLKGGRRDRHASLRPDNRAVQFLSKAPSRHATITTATHSYKQPGKALAHQDAARAKGYQLTNCAGVVRVWKLDKNLEKIKGSSIKMVVTEGLRFYDAKKVVFQ